MKYYLSAWRKPGHLCGTLIHESKPFASLEEATSYAARNLAAPKTEELGLPFTAEVDRFGNITRLKLDLEDYKAKAGPEYFGQFVHNTEECSMIIIDMYHRAIAGYAEMRAEGNKPAPIA